MADGNKNFVAQRFVSIKTMQVCVLLQKIVWLVKQVAFVCLYALK
jgi:hypothetical protein